MNHDGKLICDVCGKVLRDLNGVTVTGVVVGVGPDVLADHKKSLEQNFYPYPVRTYRTCFACSLKAFGVPLPIAYKVEEDE